MFIVTNKNMIRDRVLKDFIFYQFINAKLCDLRVVFLIASVIVQTPLQLSKFCCEGQAPALGRKRDQVLEIEWNQKVHCTGVQKRHKNWSIVSEPGFMIKGHVMSLEADKVMEGIIMAPWGL